MAKQKKVKEEKLNRRGEVKVKFGIKRKLLLTTLPAIIIAFVATTTLLSYTANKVISKRSYTLMETEAHGYASELQTIVDEVLSETKVLQTSLETLCNMYEFGDLKMDYYLQYTTTVDERFPNGIYVGTTEGEYWDPTWVPDEGWVCYERPWFIDGLKSDEMAFGDAYVDSQTNELCITASCKVANKLGKKDVEYVAATDVFLAEISDAVASYEFLDHGACYLLNVTNMDDPSILAAPDTEFIGKTVSEVDSNSVIANVLDELENADGTYSEVKVDGESYEVVCNKINNVSWALVSIAPRSDVVQAIRHMLKNAIICTVIALIIIIVIIETVIARTVKPIVKLTENIDKMSHGDFTVTNDHTGQDEIAYMSGELDQFILSMRKIISDINGVSADLADQAINSTEISGTLFSAATSQSDAMHDLNDTVEELAASIAEVADSATNLATTVSETSSRGMEASEKMKDTVEASENGKDGMRQIRSSMKDISEAVAILEDVVSKVGAATGEINKFVEMIGSIASQTNLLSLNAAIEAARAGEAGKGFAVVAGEIRQLADTSTSAVTEISQITTGINSLVADTVEQTKKSAEAIKESAALVESVGNTFDTIYANINEANSIVQNMVDEVKMVDEVATNVAAITEEQSASTEEILATAENLSNLAGNVSDNSETVANEATQMANTADVLSGHMSGFTVE